MAIQTRAEAIEYMKDLIVHLQKFYMLTFDEAVITSKDNLGYFAGYYDHETRLRVEELFDCVHPFLGPAKNGQPTPAECLQAGIKAAETHEIPYRNVLSGPDGL